ACFCACSRLLVGSHFFPTRRSSDLIADRTGKGFSRHALVRLRAAPESGTKLCCAERFWCRRTADPEIRSSRCDSRSGQRFSRLRSEEHTSELQSRVAIV